MPPGRQAAAVARRGSVLEPGAWRGRRPVNSRAAAVKRAVSPKAFRRAAITRMACARSAYPGPTTVGLARLRPGGDLQRLEIQNLILQALADKLLSPRAVLKFLELIRVFDDSIQTDLVAQEIRRLLCLRALIDPAKIDFLSFPETLFKTERVRDRVLGNTSILDADFQVLADYVKKFSDGEWSQPEEFIREEINP